MAGQSTIADREHAEPRRETRVSQAEVIEFLGRAETYGVDRVEKIETHISIVFLAGNRAYKLKRAIRFPFVDFSSIEKRKVFCEREVEINRRTAPELYLGVVPVTEHSSGLKLGGPGRALDWLVVMNRFDQDHLFNAIAKDDKLTPRLVQTVADEVARFHESAEPRPDHGGLGGLRWVIEDNISEFETFEGHVFEPADVSDYQRHTRVALAGQGALLDERRLAGFVRQCHGDLHLGNICLFRGRPTLFDAIEFNDSIACSDVLYDIAFLIMDLCHRRLYPLANHAFNRYLAMTGDFSGLAAFGLFLSCRAAVRAKIRAIQSQSGDDSQRERHADEARAYLREALAYLVGSPPTLIAVGGLSGSGKSTLAAALAPRLGPSPGAVVIRSDVVRKRLLGRRPEDKLGSEAYTPEMNKRIYAALYQRAAEALSTGYAVIADATFTKSEERSDIARVAREVSIPFAGIWLDVPPEVLKTRVRQRYGDASDATAAVLEEQLHYDVGEIDWHRLDASTSPDTVRQGAEDLLELVRHGRGSY